MGIGSALRERRIRQLGLPPFVAVDASTDVQETIRTMQSAKLGSVLVTENDRLVGIFTERDFIAKVAGTNTEGSRPIRDLMTPNPATLHPDDSVFDAIRLMDEHGYRNVPIVDEQGHLTGSLPVSTLIDFLAESLPQEVLALPPRANQQFSAKDGA